MSVVNVACDMKGHSEPGRTYAHNEEAGEANLVEILRIQEEIRDAQILPECARDHREEDDPTKQKDVIALYIVQKQLNRKGIADSLEKGSDPLHGQYSRIYSFFVDVSSGAGFIYCIHHLLEE